jgi:hypothetical protein
VEGGSGVVVVASGVVLRLEAEARGGATGVVPEGEEKHGVAVGGFRPAAGAVPF